MTTSIAPMHVSILASAGTGKTYQLASRYLKLVLDGADPRTILATTFTRAAAAEIQERILTTAAHAVIDESSCRELAGRTGRDHLEPAEVTRVLATLVEQLRHLQIQTIDSTFAGIAGAAAPELGLPEGLGILESDDEVGLDHLAVRRTLEEAIRAEDIDVTLDVLDALGKGGGSGRSVVDLIDQTISRNLLTYHDADGRPGPWRWPENSTPPEFPLAACVERLKEAATSRENVVGKADAICKNFLKLSQAVEAKRGERGDRLRSDDWSELLKTGIASKIIKGESLFSRCPIDDEVRGVIQPLIDQMHAIAFAEYAERTASSYLLLHRYASAREALRSRLGIATFDDVVRLLRGEESAMIREDLWYRLDARVRHLMLDEFQDTSLAQWKVLKPLAEEIVSDSSGERSFFCVGDVKQSIYGWRGGLPGILEHLDTMIFDGGRSAGLAEKTLSDSWRSASEVLEAVNLVFGTIERNSAIDEKSQGAATSIATGWKDHRAARTDLSGHAELRVVDCPGGNAAQLAAAACVEATDLARSLHERHPHLSIGVLAPKNRIVGSIVARLRAQGVEATGEGGGSFLDCGATVVIMDALRLAAAPSASGAAFNVLHSPLAGVVGISDLADAEAVSRRLRLAFLATGVAGTLEGWIDALSGMLDERETGRVQRLLVEVERIEQDGEVRPDRIAKLLERIRLDEPGSDAVRVMTIHKSKGLEFDVVILAGLDDTLFSSAALASERTLPPGDVTRVFRWTNETVRPPRVEPLHEATRIDRVRERLCQLYVAMTRARRGLYMLVGPSADSGKNEKKSMAGVLRDALTGHGVENGDGPVLAHFGAASALSAPDSMPSGPDVPVTPPVDFTFEIDGASSETLALAAPPSAKDDDRSSISPLSRSGSDAADVGTAWHHLLEQVEWIEDWLSDPPFSRAELVAQLERLLPEHPSGWHAEVVDRFHLSLESPGVRSALSRDLLGSAAEGAVRREWAWLGASAAGAPRNGIIDRVVIQSEAGAPRRAFVIDWKTDRVPSGGHDQHAERYRDQLASYRGAVAGLTGLDPTDVTASVVFVRDGVSVDLVSELGPMDSEQ